MSPADPRALLCPTCGALNGAAFARCVRCGRAMSAGTQSLDGARRYLDGATLNATRGLVGFTLLVFVLQTAATLARGGPVDVQALIFGANPVDSVRFGALLVSPVLAAAEPWRMLSAVFVHYGLLHVGMNMLVLSSLGRLAEPTVGSARFVVAYAVTGIAGFAITVAHAALVGGSYSATAGASGAVLGVMGLMLGWFVRRRDPRWKDFAFRAVLFGVIFGFATNASHVGLLVNNAAHLGGLACGTLFGLFYAGSPAAEPGLAGAHRGSDLALNTAAALAVVACLASLGLAQRSPTWRVLDRGHERASLIATAPRPV